MSTVRNTAALAVAALVGAAALAPVDAEARNRNFGRNAAIAGAVGVGILAVGAAAAAANRNAYYGDQGYGYTGYGGYDYPAYAEPTYAYPAYGYGYEEAPAYYAPQPRWQGPRSGRPDPARGGK